MDYACKILQIRFVTHDVKAFSLEKPAGFTFIPGQAADVAVNQDGWREKKRPFTFTGLADDLTLEFTIKRYSDHRGVTDKLHQLSPGDELLISDPWGAIQYKGPGFFIAGGAGITPFIAILRQLKKENKIAGHRLAFSNKTTKDIICQKELEYIFNWQTDELMLIVTNETESSYLNDRIDETFLKNHAPDLSQHFYLCGPPGMVKGINETLGRLGAAADNVVFEK